MFSIRTQMTFCYDKVPFYAFYFTVIYICVYRYNAFLNKVYLSYFLVSFLKCISNDLVELFY